MSNLTVNIQPRKYEVSISPRLYTTYSGVRYLTVFAPRREFGMPIQGWRLWGQTDIHPFQVGGEDSTKTFGELP